MPRRGFLLSNRGPWESGIAVHPKQRPLLGQVGLEWGVVQVRRSVQNKVSIIPNIGTDKLHQDGSEQFNNG